MKLYKPFSETLNEILQDPQEAAGYLNAALEDGHPLVFMKALRDVAEAHGGLLKMARKTKLNRGNLYRILSERGNPEIMTLEKMLESVGLKIYVGVRKKTKLKKAA
jgi:probable addiction module antidote protein